MFESRTRSRFRADPTAGFIAGQRWVYFGVDRNLVGYALWGAPDAEDVRKLVSLLVDELERPPHDALVDLEHLDVVVPDAFSVLASYTVEHAEALSRVVRHTAIVKPRSLVNAAVVAGFFDVSSRPFPVTLSGSREEALASLGRNDAVTIATALDELRVQLTGEPALVLRVRDSVRGSIEETARGLGLSVRTLQRRLSEHGTSFEALQQDTRIAEAKRRLRETDASVTTIAFDLGFRTPQHFATVFRKKTGRTPSEWRTERRLAPT
jgi:AraC-like DNA-binding protein